VRRRWEREVFSLALVLLVEEEEFVLVLRRVGRVVR
jgi:hypothetical protein